METRRTNALAEGINRKVRVVTSRAYGFKSAQSLMAMIFLCCGGIALPWPHIMPM